MRFVAYTPDRLGDVAALADRVFGAGYFAGRKTIAGARDPFMSLCISDEGAIVGFARGRVLPPESLGDFLENRVEDVPEDLRAADIAGVIGTIVSVGVASEYQGKGIGSKLLVILHDQLVGQGGDKLIATFRRGPGVHAVDGIMRRLGFEYWTSLHSFERDRCDGDDFHCVHRTDRCVCEALFYRKVVY